MKAHAKRTLAAGAVVGLALQGAMPVAFATSGSSSRAQPAASATQSQPAASKPQQQQQQQRQSQAQQGAAAPVALLIVPVVTATADNLNNGCWARFYSDQNFKGDVLAMGGPVDLPNLDRAQPFWGEADSAIVGPKARVTTYDNDDFNDQTAVLNPGQRITNLRERMGWFEGIESVRVQCTGK